MGQPDMIELFAPAKINLGLLITGKLANGYHSLDTVFAALNVGDDLRFWPTDAGINLSVHGAELPTGPENLVHQAASLYFHAAQKIGMQVGGIRIELNKKLPIASGLGGGSSDAATCLLALSRLCPGPIDLKNLALQLGADVSFFLESGLHNFFAAQATGIGEMLVPLNLPEFHAVLVNPGTHISAREAYENLANISANVLNIDAIVLALKNKTVLPYRNDLEIAIEKKYSVIAEIKKELLAAGLHSVLMSGSGSTCFGLADSASQANEVAIIIKNNHPNWWVVAAKNLI